MKKILISIGLVIVLVLNIVVTFAGNDVFKKDVKDDPLSGGVLPGATITCDAPRYGKCNALFAYDVDANAPFGLRSQPVWYYCSFTGNQNHNCTFWQETIFIAIYKELDFV